MRFTIINLIPFQTLNHQYDYTFDWTMLKQKAAQSAAAGVTGTTAAATAGATPISGGRQIASVKM